MDFSSLDKRYGGYKSFGNKKYKERSFTYEQLINYYPKHHLFDEILNSNPTATHINYFIDLKNIMQTVYLEFAIRYLINDSIDRGFSSPWIFESFIAFLGFHKDYVASRGKTASFYVFFETGDSGYHKRIYKDYKCRRKIDKAFGLTAKELKLNREIWQRNLLLIEKAASKIPDVHVLHMKNLEADFIPYYLMSRNKVDMSDNVINVSYSTDHDLYQNTLLKNSYTYYRHRTTCMILDKYDIVDHYNRKHKSFVNTIEPEYYPIFIAMTGDTGDDIPVPVRGGGPVRVGKVIKEFVDICGGIENMYNIASNLNNTELISEEKVKSLQIDNTWLRKFVENNQKILMNMRLMCFEVLSRVLDNSPTGTMLELRKYIDERIYDKTSVEQNILNENLNKIKVFVEEKYMNKVYMNLESSFDEVMKTF